MNIKRVVLAWSPWFRWLMVGAVAAIVIMVASYVAAMVGLTASTRLSESEYVRLVREHDPAFSRATTSELGDLGHKTCAVLGSEGGWNSALGVVTNVGLTRKQAVFYLVLTVNEYCPDLIRVVPGSGRSA